MYIGDSGFGNFKAKFYDEIGRTPWSSGYGRRLMSRRSWVRIPAPYTGWTFFSYILYKNCNVCLKKMKINEKEVRIGPFKKKFYDDIVNQNDNQSILYVRYSILIDRKLCRYKVLL